MKVCRLHRLDTPNSHVNVDGAIESRRSLNILPDIESFKSRREYRILVRSRILVCCRSILFLVLCGACLVCIVHSAPIRYAHLTTRVCDKNNEIGTYVSAIFLTGASKRIEYKTDWFTFAFLRCTRGWTLGPGSERHNTGLCECTNLHWHLLI